MTLTTAGHLATATSTDTLPDFGSAAYSSWADRSELFRSARERQLRARRAARLQARTGRWQRRAARAAAELGRLEAQAHAH